jgi:hypothetical protein
LQVVEDSRVEGNIANAQVVHDHGERLDEQASFGTSKNADSGWSVIHREVE